MNINAFLLCACIVVLMIFVFILASIGQDLEEKLRKANSEYRALEGKYNSMRRYCIKDGTRVPAGKYFVVGWLNMMQNIYTEKWYYISDENLSKTGCDVDGDIITITHIDRNEQTAKEDVYNQLGNEYADMIINGASKEECQAFIKKSMDIIDSYKEESANE